MMSQAVQTDPFMNFRFGVRHDRNPPWIGFTEVYIVPNVAGGGGGVLHLRKHLGSDFINFMNDVGSQLNIGVFHISEKNGCPDPRLQIDLRGVRWADGELGPIKLDAKGGDPREQVLQTEVAFEFEWMEMRDQDASFVQGWTQRKLPDASHPLYRRVVKPTSPVIM
jgi:hypothetical protein